MVENLCWTKERPAEPRRTNMGMGVTPTWRIVPRCCGGVGKGGTELS